MPRNHSTATLTYGELDEIAEIIDHSEMTTDDLRSVCLNLIRTIEHQRKAIDRLEVRVTDLDGGEQ